MQGWGRMTGKLYHRIKKDNGKWSWVACTREFNICKICLMMEMEMEMMEMERANADVKVKKNE